MDERACKAPGCGRRFQPKTWNQRFCAEHRRSAIPLGSKRYGWPHQKQRAAVAERVAAGTVTCARCGRPIRPGEPWDLDHDDNGNGYLGPSHLRCNRATNRRGRVAARRGPRAGADVRDG